MNISNKFAVLGIVTGCISLAALYVIVIYAVGPNSVSVTGQVFADGTVIYESDRNFSHNIAQIAFAMPLVSLIFGAISLLKKEKPTLAFGAFCFGLSPVLVYTLGVFFTFMIYFGITLPIAGLHVIKKIKET